MQFVQEVMPEIDENVVVARRVSKDHVYVTEGNYLDVDLNSSRYASTDAGLMPMMSLNKLIYRNSEAILTQMNSEVNLKANNVHNLKFVREAIPQISFERSAQKEKELKVKEESFATKKAQNLQALNRA
jgi:queuine/archaeosine tRNA-ribosyltransferase